MADYGITSIGFNKKTLDILKTEFEENLKSEDAFGESIDFSEQDPLFQFSMPILYLASELWEVAENVFYSASPKFAEGNLLSNTGKYIGIARKQASRAGNSIRIIGDADTSVSAGFRITTENGIAFETLEDAVIEESGYVDTSIIAVNPGASSNVAENTITVIVNPLLGVTSVTNPQATAGGQDEESDVEFRARYDTSTAISSGSTIDAIKANLLTLTGVEDVTITENETDVEVNGIPPHSFETFVYGGQDAAIAEAIFEKKPGGIKAFGTTTIDVADSQGVLHTIGFTRPTSVDIYFKITKTVDSNYLVDGDAQIKNAILNYISDVKLGQDVVVYKVISLISNLNLSGLLDIIVELSLDGVTYSSNNISIDTNSVAITSLDKIEVI